MFLVLVFLFLSGCVAVKTNPLTGDPMLSGLTTSKGVERVIRAEAHRKAIRDNGELAQAASRRGDPVSVSETTGSSSASTGVQYPGYYDFFPGSDTAVSASVLADLMNLPSQIQEVDRRARRAEVIGDQNGLELDNLGEYVIRPEDRPAGK